MSVHRVKLQGGEDNEQIESLQVQLASLSEQLKSQTDDVEKERLCLIGIHAKIEILKIMIDPTAANS